MSPLHRIWYSASQYLVGGENGEVAIETFDLDLAKKSEDTGGLTIGTLMMIGLLIFILIILLFYINKHRKTKQIEPTSKSELIIEKKFFGRYFLLYHTHSIVILIDQIITPSYNLLIIAILFDGSFVFIFI